MTSNPDSGDALELDAMAMLVELGWETVRAFEEAFTPETATAGKPYLGRANHSEVVLRGPLFDALAEQPSRMPYLPFGRFQNLLPGITPHPDGLVPGRAGTTRTGTAAITRMG